MKKNMLFLSLVIMLAIVVTGCGKSSKTMICTMSGEVVKGTNIETEYKVTYTGKYVDLVESKEVVKSDTKAILDAYKKTVESMYSPYDEVKYYDYKVELKDDTLTSTATINYAKIDANKMIEINSANSKMFDDGKVPVDTLKTVYEQMGATCK